MKAILGTFRTTATSALQIETSLIPTHLRLRHRVLQSWTRMQTAPETHPINAAIQRAKTSRSNHCISLLEHLARTFPKYASPTETIKPYPFPPWWLAPFTIRIETDKKTAKTKHNGTSHSLSMLGNMHLCRALLLGYPESVNVHFYVDFTIQTFIHSRNSPSLFNRL